MVSPSDHRRYGVGLFCGGCVVETNVMGLGGDVVVVGQTVATWTLDDRNFVSPSSIAIEPAPPIAIQTTSSKVFSFP